MLSWLFSLFLCLLWLAMLKEKLLQILLLVWMVNIISTGPHSSKVSFPLTDTPPLRADAWAWILSAVSAYQWYHIPRENAGKTLLNWEHKSYLVTPRNRFTFHWIYKSSTLFRSLHVHKGLLTLKQLKSCFLNIWRLLSNLLFSVLSSPLKMLWPWLGFKFS